MDCYDSGTFKQYNQEEINALHEMEYNEAMIYSDQLVEKQRNKVRSTQGGTNFSVIGKNAKTWDKYKDKTFKDANGNLKAEISTRHGTTSKKNWNPCPQA